MSSNDVFLFLTLSVSSFFPDDHSRVRLQAIEGEQSSDYINANYIDVSMDTCQGLHTEVSVYGHCVCV